MSQPRPDDLIRLLGSGETALPRLVWHAPGERIELSGRVLAQWISKAADMLQEEFDAGVGTTVRLVGEPHWRLCVWAAATWAVGGTVVLGPGEGTDVLVVDAETLVAAPEEYVAEVVVALTLPALARRSAVALPPGVVDEAATVASHADVFSPYDRAADDDTALVGAAEFGYADVVPAGTTDRLHVSATRGLEDVLRTAAGAWAAGGSIVLTDTAWEAERGGDPASGAFAETLRSEGVSALRG